MIYVLFIILLIHDIVVTSKLKYANLQVMALRNLCNKTAQLIVDNQKRK